MCNLTPSPCLCLPAQWQQQHAVASAAQAAAQTQAATLQTELAQAQQALAVAEQRLQAETLRLEQRVAAACAELHSLREAQQQQQQQQQLGTAGGAEGAPGPPLLTRSDTLLQSEEQQRQEQEWWAEAERQRQVGPWHTCFWQKDHLMLLLFGRACTLACLLLKGLALCPYVGIHVLH